MADSDAPRKHEEESRSERLDRNWNELLQELRVAQTGVQILTGFLLTVPFSSGFGRLGTGERATYLTVLCGAVVSTGLLVAPVAYHRALFRKGERAWLVKAADRLARIGLVTLAATTVGVVGLVFSAVLSTVAAVAATAVAAAFFVLVWGVVPLVALRNDRSDPS